MFLIFLTRIIKCLACQILGKQDLSRHREAIKALLSYLMSPTCEDTVRTSIIDTLGHQNIIPPFQELDELQTYLREAKDT